MFLCSFGFTPKNIKKFFITKSITVRFLPVGGKHLTSPKNPGPPPLKSFQEELSPKTRIMNGQSTESLDSLSDELGSNSGGNTVNPAPPPRRVSSLWTIWRWTIWRWVPCRHFSIKRVELRPNSVKSCETSSSPESESTVGTNIYLDFFIIFRMWDSHNILFPTFLSYRARGCWGWWKVSVYFISNL